MLQQISLRGVCNVDMQSSISGDIIVLQVRDTITPSEQGKDMGYAQLFGLRVIVGCPVVGYVELRCDKAGKLKIVHW